MTTDFQNEVMAGGRRRAHNGHDPASQALQIKRAKRHTRIVTILKTTLPVFAVGVVVVYGMSAYKSTNWSELIPALPIPAILPEKLTMDNPRYRGFNGDGGSYVVTAKTASQILDRPGEILLEGISGELIDSKNAKTVLKASTGVFHSREHKLVLDGGINIATADGTQAKLKSATVLTKEGIIRSLEAVQMSMRAGTLSSNQMTLWQKTKQVLFEGDVKAHLKPKSKPDAAKPVLATATPVPSQTTASASDKAKGGMFTSSDAPIQITSEKLQVKDTQHLALFSGDVQASQDTTSLATKELEIHYQRADKKTPAASKAEKPKTAPLGGSGKIDRIVAKFPVLITRGANQQVTAESAEFFAKTQRAVLTGKVVMVSGPDRRASGDRIVLDQLGETALLTGNVRVQQSQNTLLGRRLFVDRKHGLMKLTSPPGAGAGPGRITAKMIRQDKPQPNKPKSSSSGSPGAAMAAFKTDPNAPITLEADSLEVDNNVRTAVFKGDVLARQGSFEIRTVKLSAHYSGKIGLVDPASPNKQANAGKGAELTKITARENVRVTSASGQTATGDWANFDMVENTVEIGGNVTLKQGKTVVRGSSLRIDMATGQSVIKTSPNSQGGGWASTLANQKEPTQDKGAPPGFRARGGRPSAVIFPSQLKSGAGKKKKAGISAEITGRPKSDRKSGQESGTTSGPDRAPGVSSWSATTSPFAP